MAHSGISVLFQASFGSTGPSCGVFPTRIFDNDCFYFDLDGIVGFLSYLNSLRHKMRAPEALA